MPRFTVRPNHNHGGSGFMVWDSTDEYPPAWYGFENAAQAYADARNAESQPSYRYQIGGSSYWVECSSPRARVVYPDGREEEQRGIRMS